MTESFQPKRLFTTHPPDEDKGDSDSDNETTQEGTGQDSPTDEQAPPHDPDERMKWTLENMETERVIDWVVSWA